MGAGLQSWDRLAVAVQRPLSAPAVVGAWWQHLRPEGAELRLITAWEGDELAGLAPLVRIGHRYSWAGGRAMSGEPLAQPGREQGVAEAVAAELASAHPKPLSIELEIFESSPDWATLIRRAWPKPRMLLDRHHRVVSVPRVELDASGFEGWMKGLNGKVRGDVKRRRRRFEEAGGSMRFADTSSLRSDVDALLRLHRERHETSVFCAPGSAAMLVEIGETLLDDGRFRLACVELGGQVIGSQLLFAAGPRVSGLMSGYDDAFRRFAPNLIGIPFTVEDMAAHGFRTMSLGSGGQGYKYKFATGDEDLVRHYLAPVGPRGIGTLVGRVLGDRARTIGRG